MIDISALVKLIFMLCIQVFIGVIASNKGIINNEVRKGLSNLLINIILPINIYFSFQFNSSIEIIFRVVRIIILSIIIQSLIVFGTKFMYKNTSEGKRIVLRYSTMFTNSNFIGMPLISGLLGTEALLYTSAALIPIRIFIWTVGLSLFTKTEENSTLIMLLSNPCIVAFIMGFISMLAGFKLPEIIFSSLQGVANTLTPLSMIIMGSILSSVKINNSDLKLLLHFSFIRLILIPLLVFVALKLLGVELKITIILVILNGLPAGQVGAILADKYDVEPEFASSCIIITLLLCIITLPILSLIL